VYCDGPRDSSDEPDVQATRDLVAGAEGFRTVRVETSDTNRGLAASIVAGVTETTDARGCAIVLEDDIETSPFFLRYMNDALRLYGDCDEVISVSGYRYPNWPGVPDSYFMRSTQSWGWGTWSRAWSLYESDGAASLAALKERRLLRRMDFGSVPFYSMMLRDQLAGKNDSWAIRWYATAILNGRLTLYPGTSLCRNHGFDASGTHGPASSVFDVQLADGPVPVDRIPIEENRQAVRSMRSFLLRLVFRGLLRRVREHLSAGQPSMRG